MRTPLRLPAASLAAAALVAGVLSSGRATAIDESLRTRLRHYTEALQLAADAYGSEVSYRDLVYASIQGMTRLLDPHTTFLSPKAFANMRGRQRESFYGLGILVGMRNGRLTVITPLEGGPAARLGMRAGDVISAIDGRSTRDLTLDEAVGRIKGPKGTRVTIEILRPGLERPLELTVTRQEIPQETVRYAYMMTPDTGYLAISDFGAGTGEEMAEAIATLRSAGMERLLLDLRNNGGGLLDPAVDVADQLLAPGEVVIETRGRTASARRRYQASDRRPPLDLPLVVLVNAGTASAAEVLTGAIQDHDVGVVAGTSSWGKGSVQTVYNLSFGAGIALTTAHYHTPSGRVIQRDYSSWYDYVSRQGGAAGASGRQAFHTDLGREVFGGGGITPDVTIEVEPLPTFMMYLLARSAMFDFAVRYTADHPVDSPLWAPPDALLGQFSEWLVAGDLASAAEVEEAFRDPATRNAVRRFLQAEIVGSVFGFAARHRVLAGGDSQIQRALELFDEAAEMLARRRGSQ